MTQKFAAFVATLQARLSKLFLEYGRVGIVIYVVLHLGLMAASAYALHSQYQVDSWPGFTALLGAVWLAGRATLIPRILVTLVLTPPVAKLWHRFFPRRAVSGPGDAPASRVDH
ncbi:MAG: hypothetical protein M3Y59_04050 [Myxococcota bacterium]|nr:hypothetical protein [Myxococcota bacterium]